MSPLIVAIIPLAPLRWIHWVQSNMETEKNNRHMPGSSLLVTHIEIMEIRQSYSNNNCFELKKECLANTSATRGLKRVSNTKWTSPTSIPSPKKLRGPWTSLSIPEHPYHESFGGVFGSLIVCILQHGMVPGSQPEKRNASQIMSNSRKLCRQNTVKRTKVLTQQHLTMVSCLLFLILTLLYWWKCLHKPLTHPELGRTLGTWGHKGEVCRFHFKKQTAWWS